MLLSNTTKGWLISKKTKYSIIVIGSIALMLAMVSIYFYSACKAEVGHHSRISKKQGSSTNTFKN